VSFDRPFGPNSVVLDTDAASDYIKGGSASSVAGRLVGRTMALSFVTVGEMVKWPELYGWGERRREHLVQWLESVDVVVGDEAVAHLWGRIFARAQRAGRTPPINDSWIAASCLSYGLPLLTLNTKDYQFFVDHGLRLT